jgi:hypothetical protein
MNEEFRRRLTELTNAAFDCGSFDFDDETQSEPYALFLERFRILNTAFVDDYEPEGDK